MLSIIRELIEYNRWAHLRALGAAELLSSEALHREVESSFPSVFKTLLHLYQSEYVWLSRWNGDPRGATPDVADISDVPVLRDLWHRFWKEQDAFLDLLTEPDLSRR